MKTEETIKTEQTEEKVARGLQIRNFDGKIAEVKDGKVVKSPEIKYTYDRIVLPWSRTGKDSEGNEVLGAVPQLSEIIAWAQKASYTTEFKLNSENQPEGPSIVGFLVDGINSYLNRTARVKAENTEESVFEKSIQVFMKGFGLNREQALAKLVGMTTAATNKS